MFWNDSSEAILARYAEEISARRAPKGAPRRSTRVEINGWIDLDKPVGVTSTQAVAGAQAPL